MNMTYNVFAAIKSAALLEAGINAGNESPLLLVFVPDATLRSSTDTNTSKKGDFCYGKKII